MTMKVQAHPARAGIDWLRAGMRLLRRQPLGLPAMVVIYFLMAFVPALILPPIGTLIAIVLNPFASFGLLLACRDVEAGRAPMATVFIAPFREPQPRRMLLQVGWSTPRWSL